MKLEDRDRLNNIRGIAHSIDVFTDQTDVADLARLDSDRLFMSKEEASNV